MTAYERLLGLKSAQTDDQRAIDIKMKLTATAYILWTLQIFSANQATVMIKLAMFSKNNPLEA